MRTKKANKVAVKRLNAAGKYLKANDKESFYDEVLRALWGGYFSDKLSIPLARLTKIILRMSCRSMESVIYL